MKYLIEFVENKRIKLGLSYNIEIVAVSKTFPIEEIKRVINAGIKNIGESRIQEAEQKFIELENIKFTKHLVGHLQSNKINKAIEIFDIIQSIDSVVTIEKINKKLKEKNKILPVLIEINTSGEESKFGINPDEAVEFTSKILEFKNIKIEGFMTIGPNTYEEREIRKSFQLLYRIREKINQSLMTNFLHLSMGMSDDFEIAIEEGATIIRPGRIIFGERN
ncbi:MAG: YggS family pyridoxal phosphate-dependent enzyme [Brevinematales bacterium]|nr:YggS family pyridoxal phosphate-dependent enzyme [Brevinematales bacterium]